MPPSEDAVQEPRTERVGVMVTPAEKRAVRFVADARGLTESDALRDFTVGQIMAEYADMRSRLGLPADERAA